MPDDLPLTVAAGGLPATMPTASTPAFTWPVRVYWEDTDAGGVVFYANYLKFFERARTEWLRAQGVSQESLREREGALFVVTDAAVQYREPARLDDALEITIERLEAGRASLTFIQRALLAGRCLAEARIRVGCVDAGNFRPRRIPNLILERLPAA